MPRFIVLLRGINVGKGNRIAMADFHALLEAQGFTQVKTLLNSGNAVYTNQPKPTATQAAQIAAALQAKLGIAVHTIVKSASELAAIVAANPLQLPETQAAHTLVAFAADAAGLASLQPLQALVQPAERLEIGRFAAYIHCPAGILQSKLGAAILGKAGKQITTRNWATVLKLAAIC
jgi:uncharacterized protein (DUF1697 family)